MEERLLKLSNVKDPLLRLKTLVNWEQFRPLLAELRKEPEGKGGRPPFDYLLMFQILILQRYYNLSDDQTEYQILDRMSFMRFLGLKISDKVPDSKTIWLFREKLTKRGLIEKLFEIFLQSVEKEGLILHEGSIIDASFVEVPKQRNSREENEKIKAGKPPVDWSENKKEQKDVDARWTKKNNERFYGYKEHVKTDSKSKLITKYGVTSAEVHDWQMLETLLDESDEGKVLNADSAYAD